MGFTGRWLITAPLPARSLRSLGGPIHWQAESLPPVGLGMA